MQESGRILEEIEGLEAKYTKASYDILFGAGALAMAGEVKEVIQKFLDGQKSTNDGWIPVEKQLPEEKKSVLVQWEKYDRHLNVTLTYLDVMWMDDAEDVVFETINGIPNGRVIAWRPLPEPYRPEPETEKPDWREGMLRKFDRRE